MYMIECRQRRGGDGLRREAGPGASSRCSKPAAAIEATSAVLAEGLEEALAGGVITLLFRRVRDGEAPQLERFAAGLIAFVLSPYLGPDAAAVIAERHTADRRPESPASVAVPGPAGPGGWSYAPPAPAAGMTANSLPAWSNVCSPRNESVYPGIQI